MPIKADKISRGERVQKLQTRIAGEGDTNAKFVALLADAARRASIPVKWENTRLSKIRNGIQDLSLEDVATLVHVAVEHGLKGEMSDWYWIAFGVPRAEESQGGFRQHRGR